MHVDAMNDEQSSFIASACICYLKPPASPRCRGLLLLAGTKRNVLYAPILGFSRIQLILANAVHLVRPVELADLLPRRSEPSQHVSFEIVLVNLAAGIGAIQELLTLCVRRRDAHGPWRAHIADDADGIQVRIEHLDPLIAAIAH